MSKWAQGKRSDAKIALFEIQNKSLRVLIMKIMLLLPYTFAAKIFRLFGKRVI
jgi:hypothetical protein